MCCIYIMYDVIKYIDCMVAEIPNNVCIAGYWCLFTRDFASGMNEVANDVGKQRYFYSSAISIPYVKRTE